MNTSTKITFNCIKDVDFRNLEKSIPGLSSDRYWRTDFTRFLEQYCKSEQYHLLVSDLGNYLNALKAAHILYVKPQLWNSLKKYAQSNKDRVNCALRLSEFSSLGSLIIALNNPLKHQEMLSGFPRKLLAPATHWKARRSLAYVVCPNLIFNENSLNIIRGQYESARQ